MSGPGVAPIFGWFLRVRRSYSTASPDRGAKHFSRRTFSTRIGRSLDERSISYRVVRASQSLSLVVVT
eukprot:10201288-Lingulodinium_polyedra.AAC.1